MSLLFKFIFASNFRGVFIVNFKQIWLILLVLWPTNYLIVWLFYGVNQSNVRFHVGLEKEIDII